MSMKMTGHETLNKIRQDLFNGWMETIAYIEEPAIKASQIYEVKAESEDVYEVYEAAKAARDATRAAAKSFSKLHVKVGMFEKETGQFIERLIHDDLVKKYKNQTRAYQNILGYLDSQKLKYLSQAKKEFEYSDRHQKKGVGKILKIKKDIGIKE